MYWLNMDYKGFWPENVYGLFFVQQWQKCRETRQADQSRAGAEEEKKTKALETSIHPSILFGRGNNEAIQPFQMLQPGSLPFATTVSLWRGVEEGEDQYYRDCDAGSLIPLDLELASIHGDPHGMCVSGHACLLVLLEPRGMYSAAIRWRKESISMKITESKAFLVSALIKLVASTTL